MGKDLRGRELGVGLSQAKGGKYVARFTSRSGKRVKREFDKLPECRAWIADAMYEDEHGNALFSQTPTVDAWFDYWIDSVKGGNVRQSTVTRYTMRYRINIKPYIGDMLVRDVRPIHCQDILNRMADKYSASTMCLSRLVMQMLFDCAAENGLAQQNPLTKRVQCKSKKEEKKGRVLTVDEQRRFLEGYRGKANYNQYAFILQTGLRAGELIGLRWSDVDFDNKLLRIRRTMWYESALKKWMTGEPKTKSGKRDVPLTKEAVAILIDQREKLARLKVRPIEFAENVFLGKIGAPTTNPAYDLDIARYCERHGIPKFSMHTLRHTFATRCIESGMKPKTLQMILGHANISMTMDLYVHVTDNERAKEIASIEDRLKVV